MDCSTADFSVFHCFSELVQIHVHWFRDAIQLSHALLAFSPQYFPVSGSLPMSGLLASGGQTLEPLFQLQSFQWITELISFKTDWFDSLLSKGLSRVFFNTTTWKHQFFGAQPALWSNNSHICTWLLESHSFDYTAVCQQSDVSAFKYAMFVIAFLPRSKHLLISWLQWPSTVILEPKKIKFATVSTFFPIYLSWSDGTRCHDLSFLNVEF